MNVLELFAGAGGGIYGGLLLGHTPICAVEIRKTNRAILLQRQKDGIMPAFPIWDDVRTFDGIPWRGVVDIVSGGFPCTDISVAGKGAGIDGRQSGLWAEMARIVCDVRPRFVFVENSPALVVRGLGRVLGDLAASGYDSRWTCLSAAACGAPHKRDRIWILAYSDAASQRFGKARELRPHEQTQRPTGFCSALSDAHREGQPHAKGLQEASLVAGIILPSGICRNGRQHQPWPTEPDVRRVADGVANWKHRLFALGNGQVPRVYAAAWRHLSAGLPHPD